MGVARGIAPRVVGLKHAECRQLLDAFDRVADQVGQLSQGQARG
jgi:hypothetical protein